ncbi:hypothetical protein SRB5_27360 [Streptomyces sp. RB5]|uniref:Uncharacterized protein n=1 Tax=Streptomyces smaragdinus TaxID=2585196 RepID=A0A7K0CGJ8_9ACTN|nr:cellulose binding domain-containing protein [Streptomyces smaragdinus]MQY12600.1 hypothetical protein [Streptomyces smaragdinus]
MIQRIRRLARAGVAGAAAGVLLAGAALIAGAGPAQAATVTDCTQWGTTDVQNGEYTYQQNEWNSELRQCVSIDTTTGAWTLTEANFSTATNGAPATYPSSYKGCHWGACTSDSGLPIKVSELGSARSTYDTKQVASGAWNSSYDLWFNSTPTTDEQPDGTELMIWINHRGGVQPIGRVTATFTSQGRTWDVWTGPGASGWKVISYVLQGGATAVNDLDVKALIDDATARGQINPQHYLIDAEAGFEIWQGGQGMGVNQFSFEASTGPGNGDDTTPPTAPGNLRVTGTTASSASLAWDAATDDRGVTGYDVYRGGTLVGSTAGTTYTDSGLTADTTYSYTVRARDAASNQGPAAGPVTATTTGGGDQDTEPPTAPGNLRATGSTSSSVSLAWDAASDNRGVTGYDVYRDGVLQGSTAGLTYTSSGLSPSTAYSYTVRAKDAAGNVGPPAGPVTATTSGGDPGNGALKVQYKTTDSSATDNAVRMTLQLVNTGSSAQSLNGVEVRYWFSDSASSYTTWCDWAQMGCGNLTQSVVANGSTAGADHYLKVTPTSGSLAAGANTGEIQLRLHKADWSNFNEADDYSHSTSTSFTDAPKIGVYVGGQLVWGTAP